MKLFDRWVIKHVKWIKTFDSLDLRELFNLQHQVQETIDKKLEAMHKEKEERQDEK
jgi:hypothetical protein